jgi:ATP-dependent RNA helicase DeaD
LAEHDETAPTESPFAELGLLPALVAEVQRQGFERPTPIQEAAIPHLIAGKDLRGQAATGTGKTAAFVLPMVHRLAGHKPGPPRALVIVPTRELASQVCAAAVTLGRPLGVRALAVYGGAPISLQAKALYRGVDIVVATPGRARDLVGRGALELENIQLVVLDEADEMLDMGFEEDLEALLAEVPAERQTALFSATFPGHIERIAARFLRDPVEVRVSREEPSEGMPASVRSLVYLVARHARPEALARILDAESPRSALIFCRTRADVEALTEDLVGRGHAALALHGGLSQSQRERVMDRLRAEAADRIVATDVAARGIDIPHLSHVIHVDVPVTAETWVHRSGRVGRAGRSGVTITLAEPRDRRKMKVIERLSGLPIELAEVPTLVELRERRLAGLEVRIREVLALEGLGPWREVAERLGADLDPLDVAAAALRALQRATGGEIEVPPEEERQVALRRASEERRMSTDPRGGDRSAPDRGAPPARPAPRTPEPNKPVAAPAAPKPVVAEARPPRAPAAPAVVEPAEEEELRLDELPDDGAVDLADLGGLLDDEDTVAVVAPAALTPVVVAPAAAPAAPARAAAPRATDPARPARGARHDAERPPRWGSGPVDGEARSGQDERFVKRPVRPDGAAARRRLDTDGPRAGADRRPERRGEPGPAFGDRPARGDRWGVQRDVDATSADGGWGRPRPDARDGERPPRRSADTFERPPRHDDAVGPGGRRVPRQRPADARPSSDNAGWVRLKLGVNRANNVKPADLVTALCGRGGVPRGALGPITIGDRFSTLDVVPDQVEKVAFALMEGVVRGRGMRVERWRAD